MTLERGIGWARGIGFVLTGDIVNGNRTFATSAMAMSGATVTVTLGGNPAAPRLRPTPG
jgi:hypothetical protein